MAEASLAPIFQRLSQAEGYHPFTADTFSDWSVEAGDVVRIGRDGTTYQSPVHTSKLVWKGAPKMTLDSGGSKERDSVSRMSAKKYGRGGGGVRNNQAIFWEMFSEDGHLHSSIMATESVIRAEVADLYNQMASGLQLTSSEAHLYVDDKYNQMASGLRLTSSEAHLYVDNKYRQLESGLKLTSSTAKLYVDDKYNQMGSGLKLTSSEAHLYVNDRYNQLSSGLKLTSSEAHLYVNDKYNQLSSGLKLTSSSAHLYVDDKYAQMTSGLKLTSSEAHLYVNDRYNQLSSGLKLTSSEAHLYVNDRYSQLASGLRLTSSEAHLYVDNKYTQMSSGLRLTESSARLYVDDKYNEMSAGLNITSSSINLRVTEVSNGVGDIKGSSLWVNRSNIVGVSGQFSVDYMWKYDDAGNLVVDEQGNPVLEKSVILNNGSGFWVNDNGTYTRVAHAGNIVSCINVDRSGVTIAGQHINIGSVVDGINTESVTISASKINLTGYVTATEFNAQKAAFDNLTSGSTEAGHLKASSMTTSNMRFKNYTVSWMDQYVLTGSTSKTDNIDGITFTYVSTVSGKTIYYMGHA